MTDFPRSVKFVKSYVILGDLIVDSNDNDDDAITLEDLIGQRDRDTDYIPEGFGALFVAELETGEVFVGHTTTFRISYDKNVIDAKAFIASSEEPGKIFRSLTDDAFGRDSSGLNWGWDEDRKICLFLTSSGLTATPSPSYKTPFEFEDEQEYKRIRVWLTCPPPPLRIIRVAFPHWNDVNINLLKKTFHSPRGDWGPHTKTICTTADDVQESLKKSKPRARTKRAPAEKTADKVSTLVVELSQAEQASDIKALPQLYSDLNSVRLLIEDDKDALAACELLRDPPPFLQGIEIGPAPHLGLVIPLEPWNRLMDFLSTHTVRLPFMRVSGEFPPGGKSSKFVAASRKNPTLQGEDDNAEALEQYAELCFRHTTLDMEACWPKLVDAGTKMKAGGFGFAVNAFGSYIVPCDFDSLAQQSILIGKMMAESTDRPKVLERYCGDEIYPRPLAVQLVAFYLSAKRKSDATSYVYVSPEGFQEACLAKNKTSLHLSVSDQVFLATVRERGLEQGVLLWSELMGIASFLQIPTLERLIRTAVVRDNGGLFRWYETEGQSDEDEGDEEDEDHDADEPSAKRVKK